MSVIGVLCSRGHISMEEHKRCMTDPLHPCSLTEDVLSMMTTSNKEREASGVRFSPSSLQGCNRQTQLSKNRDWYIPVEGVVWSQVRGNMIHAMMEGQPAWDGILGTVREERFRDALQTKYGEQTFMGKVDLIVLKYVRTYSEEYTNELGLPANRMKRELHVKLVDYKTTGEVGHRDRVEDKHERQINMYAWLVRQQLVAFLDEVYYDEWGEVSAENVQLAPGIGLADIHGVDEVVVDELEIFYADFKKTRRFTSAGELSAKGKRLPDWTYETLTLRPIRKMKHEAATRWISRKIEEALDAETELPPPLPYIDRPFTGEALVCMWCPVRDVCIEVATAEGIDSYGQGNSATAE